MPRPALRTILPLSLITCTSMLSMDLYLPAVPSLQAAIGTSVTLAQATIALFLAGLAASQLLWGEALTRLGPRRCVLLGVGGLAAASAGCALAPDIGWLLVMRFVQGAAAGAATVVAPSVVRATLDDIDAVRGLAAISMIESIIPAAGPVLGAALLLVTDWRGTFWVLAAVTFAVMPFVVRVAPHDMPGLDRTVKSGYGLILSNRKFVRVALSHALCFGALLTFVASAPQMAVNAFGLGNAAFATLQVCSVATFMVTASQSGRIAKALGPAGAIRLGAALHVGLCALFLAGSLFMRLPFALVVLFWCGFCGALAVRGPAAFSEALALPPSQMGRASAMMMLAILLAGAFGTQAVAPFLAGPSTAPLACAMLVLCGVSAWLVSPYPKTTA